MAVLLVDVGFGDLHSTKDPAMDLYIIHMSKLILQSAWKKIMKISDILEDEKESPLEAGQQRITIMQSISLVLLLTVFFSGLMLIIK